MLGGGEVGRGGEANFEYSEMEIRNSDLAMLLGILNCKTAVL